MKRQSKRKPKPKRKPTTLTSGSDHCFPEPGKYRIVHCGVCGERMGVRRNVLGPTSYAETMLVRDGRSKGHRHDSFTCTLREAPWHKQARAIREEADQTSSKRLADLLNAEADEIVQTRTCSKDGW